MSDAYRPYGKPSVDTTVPSKPTIANPPKPVVRDYSFLTGKVIENPCIEIINPPRDLSTYHADTIAWVGAKSIDRMVEDAMITPTPAPSPLPTRPPYVSKYEFYFTADCNGKMLDTYSEVVYLDADNNLCFGKLVHHGNIYASSSTKDIKINGIVYPTVWDGEEIPDDFLIPIRIVDTKTKLETVLQYPAGKMIKTVQLARIYLCTPDLMML
jgi:hypothetical protein